MRYSSRPPWMTVCGFVEDRSLLSLSGAGGPWLAQHQATVDRRDRRQRALQRVQGQALPANEAASAEVRRVHGASLETLST